VTNADAFTVALVLLGVLLVAALVRRHLAGAFRDEEVFSCAACGREATMEFVEGWLCVACTLRRPAR